MIFGPDKEREVTRAKAFLLLIHLYLFLFVWNISYENMMFGAIAAIL